MDREMDTRHRKPPRLRSSGRFFKMADQLPVCCLSFSTAVSR